jgi:4-amino-4-deoxy-L-arabinose transferase-like glycosyltransferase
MEARKPKPSPPQLGAVRSIRVDRYWLPLVILVAILLRVAAAFYLGDQVVELPGTFDQMSYDMLAKRVLAGHGFTVATSWWPATPAGEPTAHWSYLYTLYLAAVYGVFGYHPLIARLIQAILAGLLMPWLAYRLGNRHFGHRVGLVAAGLTAVYVYFVYYSAALMTEIFYIIAILWALDVAGTLGQASPGVSKSRQLIQWPLLGIALAVAVLLRQVFVLVIPVIFGWLLWRSYRYQSQSIKRAMAGILIATAVVVLAILPWTLRNYRAFDTFVLLNTNAGFAFFWGNHPIHGNNFIAILPADGPSYQDLIPSELLVLNEAELDRALLKRAVAFIQAEPGRYLVLSVSRIKDYFKFWPSAGSGLISNFSRLFSFGILWPFMVYGLVRGVRRSLSSEALILYLFIAVYTAIHLLSWSLIRYRLPVDAIALVFAAFALVDIRARLTRRRGAMPRGQTPVPLGSRD